MKLSTVCAGVLLGALALPLSGHAQGVPGGAAHGFHEGGRIAGPVGAVVGTAVGGVIGGIEGVLGINHQHAAHAAYAEAPPAYHHRKVKRSKKKSKRYAHRSRR